MGKEVLFFLLFTEELFDLRSGAVSAVLGQGWSENSGTLSHSTDGDAEGSLAAEFGSVSVTGGEK